MANTVTGIIGNLKSSLINGENPEMDNAQQAERQLQRLSEKTSIVLSQETRVKIFSRMKQ